MFSRWLPSDKVDISPNFKYPIWRRKQTNYHRVGISFRWNASDSLGVLEAWSLQEDVDPCRMIIAGNFLGGGVQCTTHCSVAIGFSSAQTPSNPLADNHGLSAKNVAAA